MSVNDAILQDWPDAASIELSAGQLRSRGAAFAEDVEGGSQTWRGLSSCYETPHQDLLYSALAPAVECAGWVSSGSGNMADALEEFATTLAGLEGERQRLIEAAAKINAQPCEVDPDPVRVRENEQVQMEITQLGDKYKTAISECAEKISSIGNNGKLPGPLDAWMPWVQDQALASGTYVAQSHLYQVTRTRAHYMLRFLKFDFECFVSPWRYSPKVYSWGASGAASGVSPGSGYSSRVVENFRETFQGPPRPRYVPQGAEVVRNPGGEWFGWGKTVETQVKSGVSGLGRVAGRTLFIAGVGLTYWGESEKANARLAEQNPEMSAGERGEKVREIATVRAGTQVAAAAGTGAAIGAAIPVGGPVVGLAVGALVGGAMMIPTGDGKNLGDRVGDVGEAVWNWLKSPFGG